MFYVTCDLRCPGYLDGRCTRVTAPHRLVDPKSKSMIAVKLHILTRKILVGIDTDLKAMQITADGTPFSGLYVAGTRWGRIQQRRVWLPGLVWHIPG